MPASGWLGIKYDRLDTKTMQQEGKHDSYGATTDNGDRFLQYYAGH
jgi:hypothetical protein